MLRTLLFGILFVATFVKGEEAIGACKDIATLVNKNDTTKPPLINFHGNITVLAMLNASSETCIKKAEMIKGLDNQLWTTKYFQMNFVILDTLKGDQIGDRQMSERLQQAAGNVTVLSDAVHNITGWLQAERDYILVINRCGRQIFQMIDPCNVSCSDLKTAIFTTFYDNIYQFCGDCQVPYAIPVDARVQHLKPDFYKNIDNCGNFSLPTQGSELFDSNENTLWSKNNPVATENDEKSQENEYTSSENNYKPNTIHRFKNSNDESKEKDDLPLKIRLQLPNIHTINYKITKHSQLKPEKGSKNTIKDIVIEQELSKNGKEKISVRNSNDDSLIETQFFEKNNKNDSEERKWTSNNQNVHESVEETLNDNLIEFANNTSTENGFKLTNRHEMFHLYKKMLPKLRKLLEQQNTK